MPYVTSVERLAKHEGQLQGRREDVIEALEARFDEIPYQLREAINQTDDDAKLKQLLRRAVLVKSLDEFEL